MVVESTNRTAEGGEVAHGAPGGHVIEVNEPIEEHEGMRRQPTQATRKVSCMRVSEVTSFMLLLLLLAQMVDVGGP